MCECVWCVWVMSMRAWCVIIKTYNFIKWFDIFDIVNNELVFCGSFFCDLFCVFAVDSCGHCESWKELWCSVGFGGLVRFALSNFLPLSHSDPMELNTVRTGCVDVEFWCYVVWVNFTAFFFLLWLSFDLVLVCGSRAQTYSIDYFFEQMVGCEQVPHI